MPRKTRKQKIASQLHRLSKKSVSGQRRIKAEEPIVTVETTKPVYKPEFRESKSTKTAGLNINYSYVTTDLKRIGIIAILTIVLEIGLNLTLRTNFAKLLLLSLGIEI